MIDISTIDKAQRINSKRNEEKKNKEIDEIEEEKENQKKVGVTTRQQNNKNKSTNNKEQEKEDKKEIQIEREKKRPNSRADKVIIAQELIRFIEWCGSCFDEQNNIKKEYSHLVYKSTSTLDPSLQDGKSLLFVTQFNIDHPDTPLAPQVTRHVVSGWIGNKPDVHRYFERKTKNNNNFFFFRRNF